MASRVGCTEDTEALTKEVKSRAARYGFDLVGVVSAADLDAVPSHWIGHRDYRAFTKKTGDYMEGAKSVVIMGIGVWDDIFEAVIRVRDHNEYPVEWMGLSYALRLARFLERRGHRTVLEPDYLSKKRMAQLAGFGGFGKNTLIINPTFGPWLRLRSILTDAELVPDEPFTGDPCGECDECVKACPVGALRPYEIDPDRCLLGMTWEQRLSSEHKEVFRENCANLTENVWLMCTTCQRACPFGRERRGTNRTLAR